MHVDEVAQACEADFATNEQLIVCRGRLTWYLTIPFSAALLIRTVLYTHTGIVRISCSHATQRHILHMFI